MDVAPLSEFDQPPAVKPVSIAQLRAAGIQLELFDVLAVVAALCRSVVATGYETQALSAATVCVDAQGRVHAFAPPYGPGELVQQIGQLFAEWLPAFHRSVTFERVLAATQAIPPEYETPAELARALADYERPNRELIIADLYRRWRALSSATPVERQAIRSLSEEPPADQTRPNRATSTRSIRPVAALLAAGALTALVWMLVARSPSDRRASDSAADSKVNAGDAQPITPPAPQVQENQVSAPTISGRASRTPKITVVSPAPDYTAQPVVPVQITAPPDDADNVIAGIRDSGGSARTAAPSEPAASEPRTYTSADVGVQPPIAASPQRIWSMPRSGQSDRTVNIEVIVDEHGVVERAWSTTQPSTVAQAAELSLSISAIKAWRFEPALRDGRPVRFRQTIAISID
jgi:hypothetical protein